MAEARNLVHLRAASPLGAALGGFEGAFEHAAIGMALVGLEGRFLHVNRSLCRITGYAEGELLAKTFQDITHPDDLDKDLEQARRLLDAQIEAYHMEKRYLRKDGTEVWILLSGSLARDGGATRCTSSRRCRT